MPPRGWSTVSAGLLDIGETHGRDREEFIEDIRFVRTAIVDPNTQGREGPQPAAASLASRSQP